MLDIENHLPRIISFKGQVKLLPGENKVSEREFMRVWESDRTVSFYYTGGAFTIRQGGKRWTPKGASKPPVRPSKEVVGIQHVKTPNEDVRPEEQKPELPPPPVAEPIEPTPVGGGSVPGNANQAKAAIAVCSDVDQLASWLQDDDRATVKSAIKSRLAELGG